METTFKLTASGSKKLDLDLRTLQQSLPSGITVDIRSDGVYLRVPSQAPEDPVSQYLVDRELDRIYFITNVRARAQMVKRRVVADLVSRYAIHGTLPPTIRPQAWTDPLPLQLRLWSTASDAEDPFVKILVLYQIIELSNSPHASGTYSNHGTAPHPHLECKLLRNLVAHSGPVMSPNVKAYCRYLQLPTTMLDRTDPKYMAVIAGKVPLVEREAEATIQASIAPYG